MFSVREHRGPELSTVLENILRLERQGWKWVPWAPKDKKGKRSNKLVIHDAYVKDADKLYFSQIAPSNWYMIVLLRADDTTQ